MEQFHHQIPEYVRCSHCQVIVLFSVFKGSLYMLSLHVILPSCMASLSAAWEDYGQAVFIVIAYHYYLNASAMLSP